MRDHPRADARTRGAVVAFLVLGAALVAVGAFVALGFATTIHDWAEPSFNTSGSRFGLALMGTGGLLVCSLSLAAALAGVFRHAPDARHGWRLPDRSRRSAGRA